MYEPDNQELQAVIISQDMIEQITLLSDLINDETLGVKIDPLKIYCQKTGHVIGQRDENSLFNTIKYHGKNEILKSLYQAVTLSIHPAWLETNGEKLDILIDADPIGYACYCFGLITAEFYQNAKNSDRKRKPWVERYWAMARANALLTQRGIGELNQLNIELCKLLTYAPDTKSYLFKRARKMAQTPDMLAMLAVTGELTGLLRDCTNRAIAAIGYVDNYIKHTRYVDYAATPADAARGPSNIRQQKASRRDVKEAGMFAELRKLFDDSGLEGMGIFSKSKPLDGKVAQLNERIAVFNTAVKEEEMLQDLYNFGGTNLDNMFVDEIDDNENEVEVNILARSQEPSKVNSENSPLSQDEIDDNIIAANEQLIEQQDIAADLSNAINDVPINAVMVQIAKEVNKNIVQQPEIKMTALERIRARRLENKT